MKRGKLNIIDDMALAHLKTSPPSASTTWDLSHADWIRNLRSYLRMTQAELAKRAKITQPHLVAIESGKTDPKISTLRRIYQGLSCDLVVEPRPKKSIEEILRGRARAVALKRLKQAAGTMALENQAPDKEVFLNLLEKRTDEILRDPHERLWSDKSE
jgi:predicted DNA-binding mobile mystery protein A